MEYLQAVIIGIVQGLTEFLPVSSTGHMIIVDHLIDFNKAVGVDTAKLFEVFIQLGSMLAVLILYWPKFRAMATKERIFSTKGLTVWHVLAGIVPVAFVGLIAHKYIKEYLFNPYTVIIGLFVGALIMLAAEKYNKNPRTLDVEHLSIRQAFSVGLFQIFSLWPGFSRSGSTIAGGLFFGLNRIAAAEFSFIIAVPLMFLACGYDMLKMAGHLNLTGIAVLAAGFLTAFIFAYLSIVWFMKFLNKQKLAAFAYYRIILSVVVWGLLMLNIID